MKIIIKSVIIISVILLLSGCSKAANSTLDLTFKQIEMKSEITEIAAPIDRITNKVEINNALVFLYKPQTLMGGLK